MTKVGIIICGRYQACGGGKCFRSVKERKGGFARYPKEEELELRLFLKSINNCLLSSI